LIVLARRAQQAVADFSWNTLQRIDTPMNLGAITVHSIMNLILARTNSSVTEETMQHWSSLPKNGEIWLIGDRKLLRLAPTPFPAL
jgi:hypothetical protein